MEAAMHTEHSRRAEILTRVLKHVNNGNYDEENGYIVFGAASVWDMIMDLTDTPAERTGGGLEERIGNLVSESKVHHGRVLSAHRTSLNEPPEFETNALDNLLPEEQRALHDLLEKALQQKSANAGQPNRASDSEMEDALDAAFTEEVLSKVPKIVARASVLDELELDDKRQIPREDVKKYFEEAHRCYLYGFPTACAVLCRAILESALKEIIDPYQRIKGALREEAKKSGKPQPSYIARLVDEAAKKHILRDDRPKCAIDVRNAGNDAIHNHGEFEKLLGDPLGGIAYIVNSTRKILIDLYAAGS
jgi:hypothetical protein